MNPFEQWLPTYPVGTVAERPWWRQSQEPVLFDEGTPIAFDTKFRRTDGVVLSDTSVYALDAYDDAHPLPVPPPMCGQVWAWSTGEQHNVGKVWGYGGGVTFANGDSLPPGMWPPFNAVLVSGPFSPWAPKWWRP